MGKDTGMRVVLVTASSPDEGARIAEALVSERLAACVNRVDGISSVYWWKGKVERESETLLIAKTRGELVDRLIARVKELHSYSVPEVIALPIEAGNADYLNWIAEETKEG
jgi:periplasmic divalent cation tolerance protein